MRASARCQRSRTVSELYYKSCRKARSGGQDFSDTPARAEPSNAAGATLRVYRRAGGIGGDVNRKAPALDDPDQYQDRQKTSG